jgi:hypothetical protein
MSVVKIEDLFTRALLACHVRALLLRSLTRCSRAEAAGDGDAAQLESLLQQGALVNDTDVGLHRVERSTGG